MAHAESIHCARCSQPMSATAGICPHCGAPHELASLPADVPPALAIVVVLGLLTGILLLILLVTKGAGPHREAPTPPPHVVEEHATPTPAPSPSPTPSATPHAEALPLPHTHPPKQLPTAPAPGERPVRLGLPPDATIPTGASPPTTATHFPPLWQPTK